MERNDKMEVDIRKHPQVRADVRAGLLALKVQGRQIWGNGVAAPSVKHDLTGIMLRLMVGVGDLARLARDHRNLPMDPSNGAVSVAINNELKKELGNVIFSTIRWVDDLGLDVLECLDLAIEAQEKFANSGRPR